MATSNRVIITTTVAAVEVGFGIIEGIMLPNVKNWQNGRAFALPPHKHILKTAGVLLTTGVISGFLSEWVLRTYNVPDKWRVLTIAAVSIAINMIEPLIVDNVVDEKGLLLSGKFRVPTMKEWMGGFGLLTVTALMGGWTIDRIIAGIIPPQEEKPVLVPIQTASL